MLKFKLGKIVSAVGLKGELKVYPYTDYKERFEELSELYIGTEIYQIEKVRYSGQLAVLKFKGIDDRTAAEKKRGEFLFIDREKARKLPEDTYYIADLVGLTVIDETGRLIGKLTDVIQNPAQDLYEITTEEGKKALVPAVDEFVEAVDIEGGTVTLHLIDGLI